ncbi:MAG TPA: hypothetical protein VMT89_18060 [Candidatus Acidoferrales bacterium]|nr:hypothetical protein [Candidatus Acidoferrales bacterium]
MEGMSPVQGGNFADLQGLQGFIWTDVKDFHKAVTSGNYETDVSGLTGGRAVQLQSIERSLLMTVQTEEMLKAFRALQKSNATATVDEYVRQTTVGGFLGGSFNGESDVINEAEADYKRLTLEIKYMMTMRRVTMVQKSTTGVVDVMSNQSKSAILQILSDTEWAIFKGDSSCVDKEFDGIEAILRSAASSDHIIDMRGKGITPAAAEFIQAAQLASSYGNYGRINKSYMSNLVAADIDQKMDPNFRILLNNQGDNTKIGAPVQAVKTRWGNIAVVDDIFIQEGEIPFASRSAELAAIVTNANVTPPTSITPTVGPTAGSQFLAAHAGTYYWGAEGRNKNGSSAIVKSGAFTVNSGDGASLAIVEGVGSNATCFMIYRSRRFGTNVDTDMREMVRIPIQHAGGGGTTTYVDLNARIPGTSQIYCLTERPDAITIRRLLPMTKFALYPTNAAIIPWAYLLFLALRIGKPNQHVIIDNVLPSASPWQPF